MSGIDKATEIYDDVLKQIGPPPGWTPPAVDEALTTLRAYLDDVSDRFLQHEEHAIFEALGRIERYIRGGR